MDEDKNVKTTAQLAAEERARVVAAEKSAEEAKKAVAAKIVTSATAKSTAEREAIEKNMNDPKFDANQIVADILGEGRDFLAAKEEINKRVEDAKKAYEEAMLVAQAFAEFSRQRQASIKALLNP